MPKLSSTTDLKARLDGPHDLKTRLYVPTLSVALVLVLALTAACGRTVTERLDDTTITTRVKTVMLNDPTVGGLGIDVTTSGGVVTLAGSVDTPAERDRAVALARQVDGVADVRNMIQVDP